VNGGTRIWTAIWRKMPDLQPETKLALDRSGSPLVVKVELIA